MATGRVTRFTGGLNAPVVDGGGYRAFATWPLAQVAIEDGHVVVRGRSWIARWLGVDELTAEGSDVVAGPVLVGRQRGVRLRLRDERWWIFWTTAVDDVLKALAAAGAATTAEVEVLRRSDIL